MPESTELFIFDLDGVLADTEPLHRASKEEILRRLGFACTTDLDSHVGRPNQELWTEILQENGVDSPTPPELERMQYDGILELMERQNTPPSAGLTELLDGLDARGIKAAVCSSSERPYVERVIRFLGLENRFCQVVCGDEVPQRKPAPDAYLRMLEKSGVPAARALALEDSRAGTQAADGAGIRCIGYVNPTSGAQDLSKACCLVDRMTDVIPML